MPAFWGEYVVKKAAKRVAALFMFRCLGNCSAGFGAFSLPPRSGAYPRVFRHAVTFVSILRRMLSVSEASALTNRSPVIFS